MKQILCIALFCVNFYFVKAQPQLGFLPQSEGFGIVRGNCPDAVLDENDDVICVPEEDGTFRVHLQYTPHGNAIKDQMIEEGWKVDFTSNTGFTSYNIPITNIPDDIDIPKGSGTSIRFSIWVKDGEQKLVDNNVHNVDLDQWQSDVMSICTDEPPGPEPDPSDPGTFGPNPFSGTLGRLASENAITNKNTTTETLLNKNVNVFPNPFNDAINIEYPILEAESISIKLFKENGVLIYSETNEVTKNTICQKHISNLRIPTGIYICQITTDSGEKHVSKLLKL